MRSSRIDSDNPKSLASEDRLGFASHAKQLAKVLADHLQARDGSEPQSGLVVSIEGDWGTGKSTYLNFVREELAPFFANREFVMIDLDPWWLSERQHLVGSFLQAVVSALPPDKRPTIAPAVARLAAASKSIPEWAIDLLDNEEKPSTLTRILRAVRESGGSLDSWLSRGISPRKARDRVAKTLSECQLGLVVFVDDLDRLESQEALDVLSFVKSIGDIPRVVYLLAYAPHELGETLKKAAINEPYAYLEKIVQTSVQLPTPANWRLREIAIETMSSTLGVDSTKLAQNPTFDAIVVELMRKPRDIVRLSNNVAIVLGNVKGEVDPIDFASLQAIRLMDPDLFDAIRGNQGTLTDSFPRQLLLEEVVSTLNQKKEERDQRRRAALLLSGPSEKLRERMLKALFPKCALWVSDFEIDDADLLRRRSVALGQFFETYFRLEISPSVVTKAEFERLARITHVGEIAATLRAIGGGQHGVDLTESLIQLVATEDTPAIQRFATAFLSLEPSYAFDDARRDWDVRFSIARLIARAYREGEQRFRQFVLERAGNKEAVRTIGALAFQLARANKELGGEIRDGSFRDLFGNLMSKEDYALFKAHFSRAMMELANSNTLLSLPNSPFLITIWQRWDRQSVASWGGMLVDSDAGLTRFLQAWSGYSLPNEMIAALFETPERFERKLQTLAQNDPSAQSLVAMFQRR